MTPDAWAAIGLQTVVLLIAIVGLAMRIERRMATVETKVDHLESVTAQVPGISRAVARLEGQNHPH